MINNVTIDGVSYSLTPIADPTNYNGATVTINGVVYALDMAQDVDRINADGKTHNIADAPLRSTVAGMQTAIEAEIVRAQGAEQANADAIAAEASRAQGAESALQQNITVEAERAEQAEQKIKSKAVDADSFNPQTRANEVALDYKTIEGANKEITIPAATTEAAGVMSAGDKENLDTLVTDLDEIMIAGKNLLNPNDKDIMLGYYQSIGNVVESSNYNLSGYIPVKPNTEYHFSKVGQSIFKSRFTAFFDANKNNLGVDIQNLADITTNIDTAYIRLSIPATIVMSDIMVEEGDSYTGFEPYGKIINTSKLKDDSVGEMKLTPELRAKINDNKSEGDGDIATILNLDNLVDRDTCVDGRLNTTNGQLIAGGDTYKTTDYIQVKGGKTYYIGTTEHSYSARYIALYDTNKNYVSFVEYSRELTPDTDGLIRVTFQAKNSIAWDYAQVTEGMRMPYAMRGTIKSSAYGEKSIPYNAIKGAERVETILGGEVGKYTLDNVVTSNLHETELFPLYPKLCNNLSFAADVNQWGDLTIGKGYQSRNGLYAKITSTEVHYIHWYSETNNKTVATVSHNLNVANSAFIRVAWTSNLNHEYQLILSCENGVFVDKQTIDYDMAGKGFVLCDGSLSNAVLNYSNSQFKKPIWIFGDSYTSLTADRWAGVLHENGISDYMLCGIPGGYSSQMFSDVTTCLNYGTPKFIVWCLGMNDRVSGTYNTYLQQLIDVCESKNIQLVLMRIPQVPTPTEGGYKSIEEAVNQYVIASGLPYIDAYKAVGATEEGTWYQGMLSSDNVHPTSKGAQALASQVLVDFPQLLECTQ